jgi:hypothetical protein
MQKELIAGRYRINFPPDVKSSITEKMTRLAEDPIFY